MSFNSNKNIFLQAGLAFLLSFLIMMACIPVIRFENDFSVVVKSSDGKLLGAKIAEDEQWRFPPPDSMAITYQKAVLQYEDKRFFLHNGIDLLRVGKALIDNIKSQEIRSGASTITMQLARIYRRNPPRTLSNKIFETLIAWKTEWVFSKMDILRMYMAHAPFGGNVVGAETASWRYFNKNLRDLSWAEASTLAVLPRSPGLIHPGRNRDELKTRRDGLLKKLYSLAFIDSSLYELSLLESIPEKPYPIPQKNIHLVERMRTKNDPGVNTTIDYNLQETVYKIMQSFHKRYRQNGIHNMAVLIAENQTGKVLSYLGNVGQTDAVSKESYVDMIGAGRSSGSILKPLLYAQALDEGLITRKTILPDIPGSINGYRPRNFNRGYDGAVSAERALIRSLNIPMVYLLREMTIDKFLYLLKDLGFQKIDRSADHYGLPLVLGGADVTLWELVSVYASMARMLNHFNESSGHYFKEDLKYVELVEKQKKKSGKPDQSNHPNFFSAGAIWQTFNTMSQLERPDQSGAWEQFSGTRQIAWKTGTSFGFKDAWSIGISRDYTVGVWVGNADGEGRQGLVGVQAAAPVLFRVFEMLPEGPWFEEPSDDLKQQIVCSQTGYPTSAQCMQQDTILVPYFANARQVCPYHKIIRITENGEYRLNDQCDNILFSRVQSYLVLPPLMEYFYAPKHPEYHFVPPFHPSCKGRDTQDNPMAFIYPSNPSRIQIPVEYSGKKGRVVFRIAHRSPEKTVFWYVGDNLMASTVDFHEMAIDLPEGDYLLFVVDEDGHQLSQPFQVVK